MPTTQNTLLECIPSYVQELMAYKPGKALEEIKAEYGFDKAIKLASNENPFGPSTKAMEAVQKAIANTFRYPDPVSRNLREKIAAKFAVKAEEIIVGAGSESLLSILCRTVMKPGDVALMGEGAFLGFPVHCKAMGGVLKTVPSPNYRFDVDAIIHALDDSVRILYLPNPNNPTGTYITQAELDRILAALPKSTLLLIDEAYTEFCQDLPDYPQTLQLRSDNVVILRTFSKAYGLGGMRVGYGVASPRLIEQATKIKMTFEVTLLSQVAAEAALHDDAFLRQTVENNTKEKARYYAFFEKHSMKYVPSHGNFILVECESEDRVNEINEALLKQGIAIRPLKAFGFPNCLRITIGLPEENDALFKAFEGVV